MPALAQLSTPAWFTSNNQMVLHLFQAEDLVANFFPKKLLELDHFLKVRDYPNTSVWFYRSR